MNIKNYTSRVPVSRNLEAIETLLVQAGASHVARSYNEDQEITGLLFQLNVDGRPYSFKLPTNADKIYNILFAEIKRPTSDSEQRVRDQSRRTAWAILRDWVHIQLSMIRMQQAEPLEVFLPYLYDGKNDRTFYAQLKQGNFKSLTAGSPA